MDDDWVIGAIVGEHVDETAVDQISLASEHQLAGEPIEVVRNRVIADTDVLDRGLGHRPV